MDLLADDFALSPPALALLAAYDAAVKQAAAEHAAQRKADAATPADDGDAESLTSDVEELSEALSEEEDDDASADATGTKPSAKPVAVPRLAPETVVQASDDGADDRDREDGDVDDGDADLHGLLLAAGALDVDLSNVAAGVRYRVTRSGRGMLAKAA
ncbi:hypothetical protein [Alienimonas chondri]|uniref:Uncharacterized protein n=1 Tax=Alienimonas chondri TaxID=2681879 RepID=A0ABX1VIR5_9PLAN|nr:hypothetical protein [Alienimonas chondri]NNJ26716.1 hypothetical protein [Alienimonas chondri]